MSQYRDIIEALNPLIVAFEQLGIAYFVGGSVSSSFHGNDRRTEDVDVIADIQPRHIHRLASMLQNEYYIDEQAMADCVRRHISYNILYLQNMMKVDLMPLGHRVFSQEEERRAQPQVLEAGTRPIRLASAEDAVLAKLEWYHMGGESSVRQWEDIQGVLSKRKTGLDLRYLLRWAHTLGVEKLLEKALREAGLK